MTRPDPPHLRLVTDTTAPAPGNGLAVMREVHDLIEERIETLPLLDPHRPVLVAFVRDLGPTLGARAAKSRR